jgi:tRNA A37 methylthiotransferase MiaB
VVAIPLNVSRLDAGPRTVSLSRGRLQATPADAPAGDRPHQGPIRVGLVQINNSFSNQNYLPYSVGLLQAYAQRHLPTPERYQFLLPLYKRIPADDGVAHLRSAQIIGFSTYCWNNRISLEIARRIKEQHPQTIIVFGGPHVPNRAEAFLRAHPFIDLAAHGEGEDVFLRILRDGIFGDWADIPGISYLDRQGRFVSHAAGTRLANLDAVPSPYLQGVFEPLAAANPNETWIAVWETNRGCPFGCTFCDWGSATASKVYTFGMDRIRQEIEWFAKKKIEFVFCADANFGMLPRDLDIVLAAAESKRTTGYPQALSVQNTKNATERAYQVQKALADAGMNKGVTVSFQSMDPQTLKAVKRGNISTASFQELQRRFTVDGIETYSDMILALPIETYDTFADGTAAIIDNGQHNRIQFNNLSLLPNAEMGEPAYRRQYGIEAVETKIVNIHGSLNEATWDIYETQQLAIATKSMPREQWVRTRAFCWWAALLHFDKLLQIPLVVLRQCGISYRELFEVFSEGPIEGLPILGEVRQFFLDKARDIQQGGAEYCRAPEWLNIWWPTDEYIFIKMVIEGRLEAFYQQTEEALGRHLHRQGVTLPEGLLHQCVVLNASLVKTPFQKEDLEVQVDWNIWEYYRSIVRGLPMGLEQRALCYHVDRTSVTWNSWDQWFREVVWYGNKKGAYLYSNRAVERQLAGHF